MFCSFPGPAGDVQCFSGAADVSKKAEMRHRRRQKHAVTTRRFVPPSGQHSQAQSNLEATSEAESCWSRPLTMVMMSSNEIFKFGSLWVPHFVELFRPFSR